VGDGRAFIHARALALNEGPISKLLEIVYRTGSPRSATFHKFDLVIDAPVPPTARSTSCDGLLEVETRGQRENAAPKAKKVVVFPDGVSVHRRERVVGEFDRTLSLPVRLPRAESDKPRTIAIN
jgi:hypothetical protein